MNRSVLKQCVNSAEEPFRGMITGAHRRRQHFSILLRPSKGNGYQTVAVKAKLRFSPIQSSNSHPIHSFSDQHLDHHEIFLASSAPCHARFHRLFKTSMLCCVVLPFSFSSRFMRVAAAARPMEMAKMGSRRLEGNY